MSKFKSIEELFGGSDADKVAPTVFLDTGIPQLNSILTGDPTKGLPCGQVSEISGESGSGKTMLASRLMISAQQKGGIAMFYDFERAYHLSLSVKQGLDASPSRFFYKKAQCMEAALSDCLEKGKAIRENNLVPPDAPIVAIFDSFAAMVPKSMMLTGKGKEKAVDEYTMNDQTALARAASLVLRPFTIEVNDMNICAVFLNQLADTMATHGPAKKTKGGNSLPFYASTRISIKGNDLWNKAAPPKRIGKEMTFSTIKNRTRRPFEATQVDFLFQADGSGLFDIVGHYVAYLRNVGVIESAGAWLTFEGNRYHGSNALAEELERDPNALDRLVKAQLDYIATGAEIVPLTDETLKKESDAPLTEA